MASCRRIRPVLRRAVEGETTPGESLSIASHLGKCTGCRIVFAREQRLARLLDGLEDPLQVDDGFVRGVMSAIPDAPPVVDRRRGLKLAGIAGLLVLVASALQTATTGTGGGGLRSVLGFSYEGMESVLQMVGGIMRAFPLALANLDPQVVLLPLLAALIMIYLGGAPRASRLVQWSPRPFIRFFNAGTVRPSRLAAEARSLRSSVSIRRT